MNVLVDICVVPMGIGVSVSKYVVECQRIFEASGLNHEMHSYGTNVEGEWDKVMAAVKPATKKCTRWTRRAVVALCALARVSIAIRRCATRSTVFTRRWKSDFYLKRP